MVPAQQGLEPNFDAALELQQRLIVNHELIPGQGLAKIPFHLAAQHDLQRHLRFVNPAYAAAIGFCLVERQVGIPQQGGGINRIVQAETDPGTYASQKVVITDLERITEGIHQFGRSCFSGPKLGQALGSSMANSSPPSRATMPRSPTRSSSRLATAIMSSSPT